MKFKLTKEFKAGAIFVIATAILIWGLMYLKGMELFKHKMILYAVYDKVNGLVPANNVAISGMTVGQVKDLYFSNKQRGKIIAELYISVNYPIPINSVARINNSDNLIGGKYVEIVLGDSKKIAKDKDTLQSFFEASIGDELNRQLIPLKEKTERLLGSIDTVATLIQEVLNKDTRNNLIASIEHIKDILNNLSHTTYYLDTLVGSQRNHLASIIGNMESISQNLKNNNQKITNILTNFSSISDSLSKARVPATLGQINKAVTDIDVAITRINSGKGTLGLLLNDDKLYNEVEKAASDLNLLLEDIKANPKKYVKVSVF
ncbi:MAG: MlaD family protein [Bacteroidales bacterium]|jgi:phospholipid/cholesterol/gamma-HCH transport system substrate-binding protein